MFESDSEQHPCPPETTVETPIFHLLTAGLSIGLPTGMPAGVSADEPRSGDASSHGPLPDPVPVVAEADPLIEFHRDPLLAPIPIQAYFEPAAPPAPAAPTMIAPLPPTAGSSHGSALTMMTSWVETALTGPANEYGRHHRPVPAIPCGYR